MTHASPPATRPDGAIRYLERAPSARLAPWILSYWSFQSDIALEEGERYTVWPDGCASLGVLRIPPRPLIIVCVGPRHTAMHPAVHAGGRLWGFRLWPDCIGPVLGRDPDTLRDYLGAAPGPLGSRFASLAEALPESDDPEVVVPAMEAWLVRELKPDQLARPDARVRAAVRAIVAAHGEVAMAEVAREANTGLRHLQRLFSKVTGLTMREFARVRRLREALAIRLANDEAGWSRIAAESGFVDHAHLTREFVALTGLPPSGAARQLSRTTHRDVEP